jgi:hypothetical protein
VTYFTKVRAPRSPATRRGPWASSLLSQIRYPRFARPNPLCQARYAKKIDSLSKPGFPQLAKLESAPSLFSADRVFATVSR